jgi:hypothetical protein
MSSEAVVGTADAPLLAFVALNFESAGLRIGGGAACCKFGWRHNKAAKNERAMKASTASFALLDPRTLRWYFRIFCFVKGELISSLYVELMSVSLSY